MSTQSVLLPPPPSTNTLFVNVPGKGRVRSAAYSKWLLEAGWTLQAQRIRPMCGRVKVTIRIVRKDRRRRDIDNTIKPVLDLLVKHGVIEDDRHVETVTASWVSDNLTGVSVTIEALETANESA